MKLGPIGNYLIVPDNSLCSFSDDFTISFWVKPNDNSRTQGLVEKQIFGGGTSIQIYLDDGYPCIRTSDDGMWIHQQKMSCSIPTNFWSHICVRYDKLINNLAITINNSITEHNYCAGICHSDGDMIIGAMNGMHHFDGEITHLTVMDICAKPYDLDDLYHKTLPNSYDHVVFSMDGSVQHDTTPIIRTIKVY